jgi:hypothetical protein
MPTGWGTPVITPPAAGTATFAGNTITWTLTNLATTSTLSYTVAPLSSGCDKTATWPGVYDAGTGWTNLPIGGSNTLTRTTDGWQNAVLPWTNAEWISVTTPETPVGHVDYFACDNSYMLYGAGHDIWDSQDDFVFLYATVTGNFQMQATVDLQTVPNTWTKAGIMARATNADGSPEVFMFVTNTGPAVANGGNRQLAFQWRDTLNTASANAGAAGYTANTDMATVRLERTTASGQGIIGGYDNLEGVVNWTFQTHIAPNIPTGTPILVGLALTSHLTGTEARAAFTNVTRTGGFPQPTNPPNPPSNLTVQMSGNNRVQLSWTDNSTNETAFKIERKTGAGAYAEIGQAGPNSTSYLDPTVVTGTAYTYRVRASNAAGDSAYSNEIAITVTAVLGVQRWSLYSE